MATAPNRREVFLDHGRVFIETPRLMTDDELADVRGPTAQGAGLASERAIPARAQESEPKAAVTT
jgi:hypothetical protein